MSKAKKIHLQTTMADGRAGSRSVCGHSRPGRWVKILPLAEFIQSPVEHRCMNCQHSAEKKIGQQRDAVVLHSLASA